MPTFWGRTAGAATLGAGLCGGWLVGEVRAFVVTGGADGDPLAVELAVAVPVGAAEVGPDVAPAVALDRSECVVGDDPEGVADAVDAAEPAGALVPLDVALVAVLDVVVLGVGVGVANAAAGKASSANGSSAATTDVRRPARSRRRGATDTQGPPSRG